MNSTTPFQTQVRPDLTLRRRETIGSRAPMESGSSIPFEAEVPGYGQTALQAGWDKLYRARSLLEAEQTHLRDDRIALQGDKEALERREQSIAYREQRMRQNELLAALEKAEIDDARGAGAAIVRLTRAPFDMARSVFGQKK